MPTILTPEAETPFNESIFADDFASMTPDEIEASYRAMAADRQREAEALAWSEGTFGALTDEAQRSLVGRLRSLRGRRNPKDAPGDHNQQ